MISVFLTSYGISVIIILLLPLAKSWIWAFERIVTDPRPVLYASSRPERLKIIPPVGKSGANTIFISSSIVISGFLANAQTASITSPKLWGGILVAIPTAIPLVPDINKFGNLAGKTVGSFSDPS